MIFIFNTAFRRTYLDNLYRLLAAPEGTSVKLRYTMGRNAPSYNDCQQFLEEDCVVCYGDRLTGQYEYFPFRLGKIHKIDHDQDVVYFSVLVSNYCHANDTQLFTKALQDTTNSPRLTDNNPRNVNDGEYIVSTDAMAIGLVESNSSWRTSVERIAGSATILDTFANDVPPFVKCHFLAGTKMDDGVLKAIESKDQELEITYCDPGHISDTKKIKIDAAQCSKTIRVGNLLNEEKVAFSLKDQVDSRVEVISETGREFASFGFEVKKHRDALWPWLVIFFLALFIDVFTTTQNEFLIEKVYFAPWGIGLLAYFAKAATFITALHVLRIDHRVLDIIKP